MARPSTKPAARKAKPPKPVIPPPLDERPILFAQVGGPPADWRKLRIVRLANGKEIRDVYRADAHNGWVEIAVRDEAGKVQADGQGRVRTRREQVRIRIERRA